MTQENIQEVTKEEAEYQELQEHLGVIKALTDRARSDLLECIKTIASRDKAALTEAAKSLAKNLVAVEQYAGNIAKELVTEKIISASLVNALDNLTKPQEVNNDSVPEEAPKAKSINIIHPDADENVIGRGEIPSVQQVDDLAFKEEEISEIIYGNEEAKETSIDEKVTEAFDKVGTLVKEPDYNQWVHDIKEQLKNDTVRSILDRKVYFIASSPLINETAEDPNHADITQYIEVIDAESLKYILIERHAKGHVVNDTILFEVDDQDVVEDHVFGRVNRHRYVGPDNRLTTLAKSLIKEVPNQHAFHHPYVVAESDC
jgi:hypothetical protein